MIEVIDKLTEIERANVTWPMTDTLRMEAAMVLWEEFDRISQITASPAKFFRESVGTNEARHDIMELVEPLHLGWGVCDQDAMCAFDWEFTPWFMANCVTFEGHYIALKPDYLELCRHARNP